MEKTAKSFGALHQKMEAQPKTNLKLPAWMWMLSTFWNMHITRAMEKQVISTLTKFRFSYLLISESLRIMNEVMVLLNPKMLEKEVAGTITPKLNEQSIDEPL